MNPQPLHYRTLARVASFLALAALHLGTATLGTVALATVVLPPSSARGAAPIQLAVDASESARRILHVRMTIPVAPGPLVLVYPEWIPGEHGPTGPVTDVAGLVIRAGDRVLRWRRDETNMFQFLCDVPAGSEKVAVSFDFLSPPPATAGFTSGASLTPRLAVLNWNEVLMYPKGAAARDIQFHPRIKLPAGWRLGTALKQESTSGGQTSFAPVSLEALIDSPVICGEHFREVFIGTSDGPPHFIELAADSAEALAMSDAQKAKYDRLVAEAGALFGARPYGSYRFLLAASDQVAHFGLEHHQSSDDRVPERMLIDDKLRLSWATLLPHEFVHTWNGKFRRPADMVTADYHQPLKTNLLWVYEGLTQYLGLVLTARSGLWTPEDARDHWADIAQWAINQRGRSSRSLEDTAVAAQLLYRARPDYAHRRRGTDFYDEGALIWLEVDVLLREQTAGRRSLDDFCHKFHGGQNGLPSVKSYTLDEIVATLNELSPYDWKTHLESRTALTSDKPPLSGVERSGWRLTYAKKPSEGQLAEEADNKLFDLSASIGLSIAEDGRIKDVVPGEPADRAGIAPAMKLVAVNSRRFSPEALRAAIAQTSAAGSKLELLVENGEFFSTHVLNYHGGERYPRLERVAGSADVLMQILKPRVKVGK
jgi:predicted metalloprotease with PDZ domain